MVEVLCKSELVNRNYPSALNLCDKVSEIIQSDHPELLESFAPYAQAQGSGKDWRHPSFYNWCNNHFKEYKAASIKVDN